MAKAKVKRTPTASSAPLFVYAVISPIALSASQNDYTPSGLSGAQMVRIDLSDDVSLTGLGSGSASRVLTLINVSTDYSLLLEHQHADSAAANRFICPNGQDLALRPGGGVTLWYDGTSSRWRFMASTRF